MVAGARMSNAERKRSWSTRCAGFTRPTVTSSIWIEDGAPSRRARATDSRSRVPPRTTGSQPDLYRVSFEAVGADRNPTRHPLLSRRPSSTFARREPSSATSCISPQDNSILDSSSRSGRFGREKPDLVAALSAAVSDNDLARRWSGCSLGSPNTTNCRRRSFAIAPSRPRADGPPLTRVSRLNPGHRSPAMPALRHRLAMEGDLDPSRRERSQPGLRRRPSAAVKRFEERHRLKPDGILDPDTVEALNVPVEAAHPDDRAQSRALALAARRHAGPLSPGERAGLPAGSH